MTASAVRSIPMKDDSTFYAVDDLAQWTIGDLLDKWRNSGDTLPEAKSPEHHWPEEKTIAETIAPAA